MTRSQILLRFGGAFLVFGLATSVVGTAQGFIKERRAAKQAAELARYDLNHDGQITRDERRTVRAQERLARSEAKAARAAAKAERRQQQQLQKQKKNATPEAGVAV